MARALAWHARGHRFEPGILHQSGKFKFELSSPLFFLTTMFASAAKWLKTELLLGFELPHFSCCNKFLRERVKIEVFVCRIIAGTPQELSLEESCKVNSIVLSKFEHLLPDLTILFPTGTK